MNHNYRQLKIYGHCIAPLAGIVCVLVIGGILYLFDGKENVINEGPLIEGNSIIYIFFGILCICAYLFQFVLIRPLYNYLELRKRLKRITFFRIGVILTIVFALLNIIPLYKAEMNFVNFSLEMLMNLNLWASYFIVNSMTYWKINKQAITTANNLA